MEEFLSHDLINTMSNLILIMPLHVDGLNVKEKLLSLKEYYKLIMLNQELRLFKWDVFMHHSFL